MFTESSNLYPWVLGLQWLIFEKSTPPFNFLINEGKLAFRILKNKFRAKAYDAKVTTNVYILKAFYAAIKEISKKMSDKGKAWQTTTNSFNSFCLLTCRPTEQKQQSFMTTRNKINKTVSEGVENSFKVSNTSNLCDESFAAEKKAPLVKEIKDDYSSQQTSRFNNAPNESATSSSKNTERRADSQKEYETLQSAYNQLMLEHAKEKKDLLNKIQILTTEKEQVKAKYEEELKKLNNANKLINKYSTVSKENSNPNCRKSVSYSKQLDVETIKVDFFKKKICEIIKLSEGTSDTEIYRVVNKSYNCMVAMPSIKEQLGCLKEQWGETLDQATENYRAVKEVWPHFISVMTVQGGRLNEMTKKYYDLIGSPS
jgi:uncharacterized protein